MIYFFFFVKFCTKKILQDIYLRIFNKQRNNHRILKKERKIETRSFAKYMDYLWFFLVGSFQLFFSFFINFGFLVTRPNIDRKPKKKILELTAIFFLLILVFKIEFLIISKIIKTAKYKKTTKCTCLVYLSPRDHYWLEIRNAED